MCWKFGVQTDETEQQDFILLILLKNIRLMRLGIPKALVDSCNRIPAGIQNGPAFYPYPLD